MRLVSPATLPGNQLIYLVSLVDDGCDSLRWAGMDRAWSCGILNVTRSALHTQGRDGEVKQVLLVQLVLKKAGFSYCVAGFTCNIAKVAGLFQPFCVQYLIVVKDRRYMRFSARTLNGHERLQFRIRNTCTVACRTVPCGVTVTSSWSLADSQGVVAYTVILCTTVL